MDVNVEIKKQVEFAKAVIRKVALTDTQRIARGLELRRKMWDDYKADKTRVMGTYRYEWIKSSANKVNKLLRQIAYEFNVTHSEEAASNRDMLDILIVANNHIIKREKGK